MLMLVGLTGIDTELLINPSDLKGLKAQPEVNAPRILSPIPAVLFVTNLTMIDLEFNVPESSTPVEP